MGIAAKLVRDEGTISDPYILAQVGLDVIHYFRFLEVNTYSSTSVVFRFAAFDVSPQGQYDFSAVFAKDVVGMHILREQIRNEPIFWCAS